MVTSVPLILYLLIYHIGKNMDGHLKDAYLTNQSSIRVTVNVCLSLSMCRGHAQYWV